MKCSSSTGKFLALLVSILSDQQICAQRPTRVPGDNNSGRNCPSGTRCVERSRCSFRILSTMTEQPRQCGFTYNGQRRICCPQATSTSRPPPTPSVTQSPASKPEPNTDCGTLNGLQGFEIGGRAARQGAWPWLVAIQYKEFGLFSGWCTGSMITRRHVVSAAHCYEDANPSMYLARVGHVNQSQAEQYSVRRIVVPETYVSNIFYDDIAILTLTRDVDTENFVPICLPPRNFVNLTGKGTTVAGWGTTEVDGPLSESLQQLSDLPVMTNERCESELTTRLAGFRSLFSRGISEGFICAAFIDEAKDTCSGDSGGPMMFQERDR